MAAMERTVSVASLASITEGSETHKKKSKNTSVTVGFKYHWFETTLNFVKDDRRLSLNYSVTTAQAIFIRNVLNFEENPTLKLEKYSPLYEALKIFGLKYYFKLSKLNKDIMVLQKIPKNHKEFKQAETNAHTRNNQKVIDRLSQEYMVESSQRILDFIDDTARVTLEFRNVKPLEGMFLQIALTAAKPLFPEHGKMLQRMKETKPNLDFNLVVVVGKVNKKTNERTVTFKKDPKFGKKGKKSREQSLNLSNLSLNKNFVPSTKESTMKPQNAMANKENSVQNQQNSMQTEQKSTTVVQNAQNSNSMSSEQNSIQNATNSMDIEQNAMQVIQTVSQEPMDVDSPRGVVIRSSASSISVHSEPAIIASAAGFNKANPGARQAGSAAYGSQTSLNLPSSTRDKVERGRRDVSLNARKAKLLEAMSMPVQLDKPARMMQKMGWNGGPLGIRGEGITEPIIPALDLVTGAGLGHVKADKPEAVPRKSFRLELLLCILQLLRGGRADALLAYTNALTNKEIKFVRHAVTSFSERLKVSLKDLEEARVAKLVIEELRRLPTAVVHGTVSGCKKQIILRKLTKPSPQLNMPAPQKGVVKQEHLLRIADMLGRQYQATKQRKYFGLRVTVLVELLHFIESGDTVKELIFETQMSKQESNYVVMAVDHLNKGRRPPMCGEELEQDVCRRILDVIGDTRVDLKIEARQLGIRLEKVKGSGSLVKSNTPQLNSLNVNNNSNHTAFARHNDSEMIEITMNNDAVSNIAQNKPTNSSVSKDISANNSVNSSQRNLHNDRIDNTKSLTTNSIANCDKENNTIASTNSSSVDINNILKARIDNIDESNKIISIRNGNNDFVNGNIINENPQSEDDDVILIETKHEVIVISDDEDDTENVDSFEKGVNLESLSEKQDKNIDGVEGNRDMGDIISVVTVNTVKSISRGSEETNITQGSADMSISSSQTTSTEPKSSELNVYKTMSDLDSLASDGSKTEENVELDIAIISVDSSIENGENGNEIVTSKRSENVEINTSIENVDIASIIQEVTAIDKKNENSELDTLKMQVTSPCNVAKIVCNSEKSVLDTESDINVSKIQDSITLNTSIEDNNRSINLELAKNKTDIDLSAVKIEPKMEKYSYTSEFDNDLLDLEMVLNLDDDVFDYTVVKKEESIDKIERPSSKRSRCDSDEYSPDNFKKTKIFTFTKSKNLLIVPKDYPNVEVTKDATIKIQTILSDAIDKCKELPLLKCHGIQDGGLVYSCHTEQSLFFVENCFCASDFKIISDVIIKNRSYRMRIRFNSLIDNTKLLFSRLELYNAGLITDRWCVEETLKLDDYIVISLEIDEYSYKYICDSSFCLYAGIDEARFSVVWD